LKITVKEAAAAGTNSPVDNKIGVPGNPVKVIFAN
jgi:hypothetical protein